jgi:hypothetical protein
MDRPRRSRCSTPFGVCLRASSRFPPGVPLSPYAVMGFTITRKKILEIDILADRERPAASRQRGLKVPSGEVVHPPSLVSS